MVTHKAHENQSYLEQVEAIDLLYRQGVDKNNIMAKLIECFENYSHSEHKAHFLYMASSVLVDLHQKAAAYEVCMNIEKMFPETRFAKVAADRTKLLFVEEGVRLNPFPSFVATVQVEPTNHCNLACVMCTRSKQRKRGYMRFDTFKKVVDQSLASGAISLRLYHMGEPLLHKSIVEFVAYYRKRVDDLRFESPCIPRSIGIQTNGVMLNEKLAYRLMKAGLNHISFSIDGRTPQEYEKIRQGAVFERVLMNLKEVRETKQKHNFNTRICVSVLDMELKEEDKVRLRALYWENGAETVSFMPCALEEGRYVVNKDGNIVTVEEFKNTQVLEPENEGIENGSTARGDIDRIVVLWNGDIKSACGEPKSGEIIGNIKHMSLLKAYKEKMKHYG